MKQEQELNPEESIAIIQSMIDKARFDFSQGSFYFIIWGTLLPIAAMFEFFAQRQDSEFFYIGWPIAGIIGAAASMYFGYKTSVNGGNTHLTRIYSALWITYFVTLVMLLIGLVTNNINPGTYIMLLTGLPTFLTGYMLEFNPLKLGGFVFWGAGLTGLFIGSEFLSILFAASIIGGYLIPGLIMRKVKRSHV
ncbi:MAG: hypothetical protein Salg2KO_19870 [Salibacteraceae bacterium]